METILLDDFLDQGIIKEKSFRRQIDTLNLNKYKGKKIIIKGCSSVTVPTWAYLILVAQLAQVAEKIYYGEIPFLFLYIILPFSKLWSLLTKKRELINLGSIYTLKNQCLKISYELAKNELNHKPRSIHSTISDTISWFDSEYDI